MEESSSEATYEEREIRCPKLGGPINFGYCRQENAGLPCSKALHCWSPYFDVESIFRKTLTEAQFEDCFFKAPQTKVATLLELIERAKRISEKSDKTDTESLDSPEGQSE
jgi:hypothetical protein